MIDPSLLGVVTATLEKVVNAPLRYDPGTRAALGKLAGKVIAVDSTLPPLTFYLHPQPADSDVSLEIHAYCDRPADTRLKGSLPAIMALTFGSQHSLANSGVEVLGSTTVLSQLQDILHNVDIDWEEPITQVMGSTLGHPFAQLLQGQWQWARNNMNKAQHFFGEYVTEELRATPSKAELEVFYDEVTLLRSDTERLQARVQRLRQLGSRQGD